MVRTLLFFILFLALGQAGVLCQVKYYPEEVYGPKLEEFRARNSYRVSPVGDPLELAVNIALHHYPELEQQKIRIKYKKNVRHPITASWAFGNIFKSRKKHTYIVLIRSGTFIKRVSLNNQIGVFGHEMAHFLYYSQRSAIHMLWWAVKYVTSKKFHREFERQADRTAIDHGLGYQLLGMAFYLKRSEVEEYMKKSGSY